MLRIAPALLLALSLVPGNTAYEKQLLEWRKTRLAELTADDGWLTVVGLFWMHQGPNRAGSGSAMDLKMAPPAPRELGTFTLEGDVLTFIIPEGCPDGERYQLRYATATQVHFEVVDTTCDFFVEDTKREPNWKRVE